MVEFRTIPFESWHMKLIKPGIHYNHANIDPETRAKIYRQIEGITVLIEDEICAILGVAQLWPGVGEITMIPSDLFYKHLKSSVKFCRQILIICADTFKLHRVQATALASAPKHCRFLECLGLQFEGHLRQYGPNGEDFMMYSYVRAV